MPFVSDGQGGFIFQEPRGAVDLANWETTQRGMGSSSPGAAAAGMNLDVRALQRYLLSDGADASNVAAKLQVLTRAADPRLSTTARALLADQRGLAALQGSLAEQSQADAMAAGDARMNESAGESQQAATLRRFSLGGADALAALGGGMAAPRSSAGLEKPGQVLDMGKPQPGNRTAEVGAAFAANPANAAAVAAQAAREAGMGDRPTGGAAGGSSGGPQSTPAMTGAGLAAVGQEVFGGLLDLPGLLSNGGSAAAAAPGSLSLTDLQAEERATAEAAARDRQKALDAIAALENPYSTQNMQRSQDAALLGMQVGNLGQDRAIYTSAAARGMGAGGQTAAQGAALAGAQQAAQAMRSADIFDKYTTGRSDFEAQRANASAGILRDPTAANLALDALNRVRGDSRFDQGLSRQEAEAEDTRARANLDRILGVGGQLAGTALAGPVGGVVGNAAGQALGALGSWAFPGDKNGAGGSSTSKSNETKQQGPTQGGQAIGGYQGTITPNQSMRGVSSSTPARYRVGWGK